MTLGTSTLEGGFPTDMLTSRKRGVRRLQVEVAETGSLDGRVFRLSWEFDISSDTFIKFDAPINFRLTYQNIDVDKGGVKFEAFRDGIESGTWTEIQTFGANSATVVKTYTKQITLYTGGSVDVSGEVPAEIVRNKTGQSFQRTTISTPTSSDRILGPGVYYLKFSLLSGISTAGVYSLRYEELPDAII